MERAERVMEKASKMVSEGEKVSAVRLAKELGMHESDVHRCLNHLERKRRVRTSRKQVFGADHRMVSVYR